MITCNTCRRHIRTHESACPFCGSTLESVGTSSLLVGTFALASCLNLLGCDDKADDTSDTSDTSDTTDDTDESGSTTDTGTDTTTEESSSADSDYGGAPPPGEEEDAPF